MKLRFYNILGNPLLEGTKKTKKLVRQLISGCMDGVSVYERSMILCMY